VMDLMYGCVVLRGLAWEGHVLCGVALERERERLGLFLHYRDRHLTYIVTN
jgi:hypothetical protein